MTITAIIITKNEAANIARCLNSLQEIADEIIVLDAYSTDETPNICRSYPSVKFIQRAWEGYAASKNFADSQAISDYILSLDADEMLSEKLKASILTVKLGDRNHKAYQFNRLNHVADQPIHYSGWYPDRKVRLFPKINSKWTGDFVHETLQTESPLQIIKGDLLHYTCSSFQQMEIKQRQYAEFGAFELYKKGKHMPKILGLVKVIFKFFCIYCLKLGFLDGSNGLKIALISAKYLNQKFIILKQLEGKKYLSFSMLILETI